MTITHSKVSGQANPGDPTIVGGEDWDDAHVVSGPRRIATVVFGRSNGIFNYYTMPGVTITVSPGALDGRYHIDFDPAIYGTFGDGVLARTTFPDLNPALGYFANTYLSSTVSNQIVIDVVVGGAETITWLSENCMIWLDVFTV